MFCLGTGLTSETKWLFRLFTSYYEKCLTGYLVLKNSATYKQTLLKGILRVLFAVRSQV